MARIAPEDRDTLMRLWRRQVWDRVGFIPFVHQAEGTLASEGFSLTDTEAGERDPLPEQAEIETVYVACGEDDPRAERIADQNYARRERRIVVPRTGGVAHHLTDLAAYKAGKSKGVGMWLVGPACIPDAGVDLIGIEYKTSENEFNYLCDALLSSAGMRLKYRHYYNDSRNGRMLLELKNGATFEVRSWERREGLKGAQRTAYCYNEAYQLPGLEAYTSIAQNLRAERGFALFTTTCDRPWVTFLHEMGHGQDLDWHCSCGAPGWCNGFTFDRKAFIRDCPADDLMQPYLTDYPWLAGVVDDIKRARDRGVPGLMTRERFDIAWLGLLGTFAGRVYDYQRGQRTFGPGSHPSLWKKRAIEAHLREVVDALV